MELIDFQGLNCYQNAIITVAAFMGVDYKLAFINLWPETDFEYDGDHKIYITKRMPRNLESMGIKTEVFIPASTEKTREALSMLKVGEPFLICMDTFHIPWSPGFGAVHDLHYFAALKERSGCLSCFDPTYNMRRTISKDISSLFSKLYYISRVAEKPLFVDTCREEIKHSHPQMQSRLLNELGRCVDQRTNALLLAKYVDTLINNRYLYKHYLDNTPSPPAKYQHFFNKSFFTRWSAVKNGLYKAYVVRRNDGVIGEVSELFRRLIDEEIHMAADVSHLQV